MAAIELNWNEDPTWRPDIPIPSVEDIHNATEGEQLDIWIAKFVMFRDIVHLHWPMLFEWEGPKEYNPVWQVDSEIDSEEIVGYAAITLAPSVGTRKSIWPPAEPAPGYGERVAEVEAVLPYSRNLNRAFDVLNGSNRSWVQEGNEVGLEDCSQFDFNRSISSNTGFDWMLCKRYPGDDEYYCVHILPGGHYRGPLGKTLPEAICKAALMCVLHPAEVQKYRIKENTTDLGNPNACTLHHLICHSPSVQ